MGPVELSENKTVYAKTILPNGIEKSSTLQITNLDNTPPEGSVSDNGTVEMLKGSDKDSGIVRYIYRTYSSPPSKEDINKGIGTWISSSKGNDNVYIAHKGLNTVETGLSCTHLGTREQYKGYVFLVDKAGNVSEPIETKYRLKVGKIGFKLTQWNGATPTGSYYPKFEVTDVNSTLKQYNKIYLHFKAIDSTQNIFFETGSIMGSRTFSKSYYNDSSIYLDCEYDQYHKTSSPQTIYLDRITCMQCYCSLDTRTYLSRSTTGNRDDYVYMDNTTFPWSY